MATDSQQANVTALAPGDALGSFVLVEFRQLVEVCRSTMMAETHHMVWENYRRPAGCKILFSLFVSPDTRQVDNDHPTNHVSTFDVRLWDVNCM